MKQDAMLLTDRMIFLFRDWHVSPSDFYPVLKKHEAVTIWEVLDWFPVSDNPTVKDSKSSHLFCKFFDTIYGQWDSYMMAAGANGTTSRAEEWIEMRQEAGVNKFGMTMDDWKSLREQRRREEHPELYDDPVEEEHAYLEGEIDTDEIETPPVKGFVVDDMDEPQNFPCDCGLVFKTHIDLNFHRHTGDKCPPEPKKSYTCQLCGTENKMTKREMEGDPPCQGCVAKEQKASQGFERVDFTGVDTDWMRDLRKTVGL
jgi:hypothetical protein